MKDFSIFILLIIITMSLGANFALYRKSQYIAQFTGYKCIPGIIEHCESNTVINDSLMTWDREKRDSIYQLILN